MTDGAAQSAAPTLRELIGGATVVLREAGVASPGQDAAELAAHVLGVARVELMGSPPVPEGFTERFAAVVERRRSREPLQHIVGKVGFRHLTLVVVPGVFVPRPETELVAQVAIDEAMALADAGRRPVVVDLCCGGGAIALAVATEVPAARVVAVDLDAAAVALAGLNAAACGVELRIELGDSTRTGTLKDLDTGVDVVVANPPYIPADGEPLELEVRDHDPDLALYGGGADGLAVPRGVVGTAARLLRDGGLLVMEHAELQAAALRSYVAGMAQFEQVRTGRDLADRERMVVARRAPRARSARVS